MSIFMKITNILQFTENHRYYIYRDFSLSPVDEKMVSSIYQSMIGAFAIGLYQMMYRHIPIEQVGYSGIEQQRRLFHILDLEPSEKGRRYLIEQMSRLEAVGLLLTYRQYVPDSDEYLYEYELQPPLSPAEFFQNQHLTFLLRDKVGKFMVLSLREQFSAPEPEEISFKLMNKENISVPFYELFRLNTQVIDLELEQALSEFTPARQSDTPSAEDEDGIQYSDIIVRFPRQSANRLHVENLRLDKEQMAAIQYVVRKYGLSVQDVCRLLDEDGIFTDKSEVRLDALQHKANSIFRQGIKREEDKQRYMHKVIEFQRKSEENPQHQDEQPVQMEYYLEVPDKFIGQCDIHQYNMILRNEPYLSVLKRFFPGAVPRTVLDIFEKLDLQYKLKEEVINVLIHYIGYYKYDWKRSFIDSIAADMLGKQVDSYEQAVQYVRDYVNRRSDQAKQARTASYRRSGYGKQKPNIPIIANVPAGQQMSVEKQEEIRRLARELDGKS